MEGCIMDSGKVKKVYLMRLLISPLTLVPFFLGSLGGFVLAAKGDYVKALFAFGATMAVSAGATITNAMFRGEKILEKSKTEVIENERRKRESDLDDLYRALSADNDPRDEKMLEDLRALFRAIQEDSSWKKKFDSYTVDRLQKALEELFDQQVTNLKEALGIKHRAARISNRLVKTSLTSEREKLLKEVDQAVKEFVEVFGELRGVGSSKRASSNTDPNGCLARLRQAIEVGKRVRADLESVGLERE
jgi:hypothetical protein